MRKLDAELCVLVRVHLQMNALHEPWNDDALSEDLSWGAAPALAQSSDALADTAASGGAAAAAAGLPGGMPTGLAALGPGQELDLGVSYRGPKVRHHHECQHTQADVLRLVFVLFLY
jgi:hypothetical protein